LDEPLNFRRIFHITLVIAGLLIVSLITLVSAILIMGGYVDASMFKTDVSGTGTIDIRETAPDRTAQVAAMAVDSAIVYASLVEWGQIVTFSNSFDIFGATAKGGYRNQYVVKATGGGYNSEYRATAIEGDFAGDADLILRNEANPGPDGEIVEASIKLDSANGKSILDLRAINRTTGRPVTAFELDGVGNFTFQQYLLLNATERENMREEDFCESLDRILPRDFSGTYIAPHGKKLTADADLTSLDAVDEPVEVSTTVGRFAEEQSLMDAYRAAHPEEFEEEVEEEGLDV